MKEIPGPRAASIASESAAGVLGEVRGLFEEITGLLHDHVKIATLETKQVGVTLSVMIALGIGASILIFTAWLALMGAIVLILVEQDILKGSSALGVVFLANLLIASILLFMTYRQRVHLQFAATARSIKRLLSKPLYDEEKL